MKYFVVLFVVLFIPGFSHTQTRYIDIYAYVIEYNNGKSESMSCDVVMSITPSGKVYIGNTLVFNMIYQSGPYWDKSIWQAKDNEGIKCKLTFIDIDGYSRKVIASYSNVSFIYFGTEE